MVALERVTIANMTGATLFEERAGKREPLIMARG
jgi:hypothetical protein